MKSKGWPTLHYASQYKHEKILDKWSAQDIELGVVTSIIWSSFTSSTLCLQATQTDVNTHS